MSSYWVCAFKDMNRSGQYAYGLSFMISRLWEVSIYKERQSDIQCFQQLFGVFFVKNVNGGNC